MKKRFTIAGMGETLWDVYPDGARLGGAPTNFACHAAQLGERGEVISCVGGDAQGEQARVELAELGVGTDFIHVSETLPTGTVEVELDGEGKPRYAITADVAWDAIPSSHELLEFATTIDAVCFGVLSQRSEMSRTSIQRVLERMPEGALKVLDVNLREPWYDKNAVELALVSANVLKLSDEELPVLAEYFDLRGSAAEQLECIRQQFNLRYVVYTCGAEGSALSSENGYLFAPSSKAEVVDSVGAGDAFTASFCVGLLRGYAQEDCLKFANRVAGYVCAQSGACPELPASIKNF
ncbi:carbohydrate kinase [Rubritalea spongiae]|uniref:Carbohydrate kinase n=1 Tax=Rubritalea spongiae TaxID=430797 RepID=A0ABW5DZH2_9BACT